MISKPLGEIADVFISNVDKKSKDGEKKVKLCNFVDVYYNWAISSYNEKDFMIATASDSAIEKFTLHKGDVAITKDSETRDDIGVATYIAEELENVLLGYHCVLIRPKSDILDGKYLNVILHSSYAQKYFEANASGSGQRYTLTDTIVQEMPIPLPDIELQRKISELPSYIDRKIENNNKINDELEAMINMIYSHWFLQYEFPDANEKAYKSNEGKMVWSDELKREIPEGWGVKTLDECLNTIIDRRGVTPKKLGGDWSNEGILALSAKIVKNNKLVGLENANIVSRELYEKWMTEKLKYGDILMTSEAPLGEFYYLVGDVEYCLSQRLFALRANEQICDSTYLFYELYKGNGYSQIIGSQSGSTVFGIRQDELRKIKILVPPKSIQEKFAVTVISSIEKIRTNDKQNRELESIRKFILPMLVSGQIKCKEE